jgi:hypothetical protein
MLKTTDKFYKYVEIRATNFEHEICFLLNLRPYNETEVYGRFGRSTYSIFGSNIKPRKKQIRSQLYIEPFTNLKLAMHEHDVLIANIRISKNGVVWDVTPCGSCKNRRFRGTWGLLHQSDKNR